MLKFIRELKKTGIIGLNRRNADYILRYNARRLFPLVDDKLATKKLAGDAGVAVPELYGVISIQRDIRRLPEYLKEKRDFVVKPAHGSGGEGIIVITGQTKNGFRKNSGLLMTREEMYYHISRILTGVYSLGGHPDNALIERRVRFDPIFEGVSYLGVPDIRIIVFLGVPVMAMVRLPTRESDGKANLHQGAVGSGIDFATGMTLHGVWHNRLVEEHPDTGNPVPGIRIPRWMELLNIASRCYELTGLGYIGVDIVLDRDDGPLLLELNARPGLNIQMANRTGLLPRLQAIEQYGGGLKSIEERVAFAVERFKATAPAEIPATADDMA